MDKKCYYCGEKLNKNAKKYKKYCNRECYENAQRQHAIDIKIPIGENRICRICNQLKDIIYFFKINSTNKKTYVSWQCKECFNLKRIEKKRKIKESFKENRDNKKILNVYIKKWASSARCKKFEKENKDRKSLTQEQLINLAYEGIKLYPYIDFASVDNKKATLASLDRKDGNFGYVENNMQVIPLWLNCAKIDFSQEEFESKLNHYISINSALSGNLSLNKESDKNECLYDGLYDNWPESVAAK